MNNVSRDLMLLAIQAFQKGDVCDAGTLFAASLASKDSDEFISGIRNLFCNEPSAPDVVIREQSIEPVHENKVPEGSMVVETENSMPTAQGAIAPNANILPASGLQGPEAVISLSVIAKQLASAMEDASEDAEGDSEVEDGDDDDTAGTRDIGSDGGDFDDSADTESEADASAKCTSLSSAPGVISPIRLK